MAGSMSVPATSTWPAASITTVPHVGTPNEKSRVAPAGSNFARPSHIAWPAKGPPLTGKIPTMYALPTESTAILEPDELVSNGYEKNVEYTSASPAGASFSTKAEGK